jgi:hypothetical protein
MPWQPCRVGDYFHYSTSTSRRTPFVALATAEELLIFSGTFLPGTLEECQGARVGSSLG